MCCGFYTSPSLPVNDVGYTTGVDKTPAEVVETRINTARRGGEIGRRARLRKRTLTISHVSCTLSRLSLSESHHHQGCYRYVASPEFSQAVHKTVHKSNARSDLAVIVGLATRPSPVVKGSLPYGPLSTFVLWLDRDGRGFQLISPEGPDHYTYMN